MKNYSWKYDFEKRKTKEYQKESRAGGFTCSHCKQFIIINDFMGTAHRNHCNYCLWSKHVDLNKPGDRKATCRGGMKPIGLTLKNEKQDKYGRQQRGELKLIHWCVSDMSLSTNRIAADDSIDELFFILSQSLSLHKELRILLQANNIRLLDSKDEKAMKVQILGRRNF